MYMLILSHMRWRQLGTDSQQRLLGWFFLTLGTLGAAGDLFFYQTANVPYLLFLIAGLWLIMRATHIFDEGETARTLRQHHQATHRASKLHARLHHVQTHTAPVAQSVFSALHATLLAIGAVALSIFVVLLWVYQPLSFLFLLALCSIALVLTAFFYRSAHWLLVAIIFTLASISQVGSVVSLTKDYQDALFVVFLCAPVLTFLVSTYFHQTFKNRRFMAGVLTLASAAYITIWLQVSNFSLAYGFKSALISLACIAALMALIAWSRKQRLSFAKYLLSVGIVALFFYVYLFWSSVAVTLTWLAVALAALIIGFLLPSYSARMAGLLALAIAILYYLVVIVPEPITIGGPLWSHARVWMGVSIGAFVSLCWWWYGFVSAYGKEDRLVPLIKRVCVAVLCAVGVSLVLSEVASTAGQGIAACILGLGFLVGAYRYRSLAAGSSGVILLLYAVLEMCLAFNSATPSIRLFMFLSLGIVVLPGSLLIANRR
jgi:hypothetical protein